MCVEWVYVCEFVCESECELEKYALRNSVVYACVCECLSVWIYTYKCVYLCVSVCKFVCVCERERDREGEKCWLAYTLPSCQKKNENVFFFRGSRPFIAISNQETKIKIGVNEQTSNKQKWLVLWAKKYK